MNFFSLILSIEDIIRHEQAKAIAGEFKKVPQKKWHK
jgi:hypothetical protein